MPWLPFKSTLVMQWLRSCRLSVLGLQRGGGRRPGLATPVGADALNRTWLPPHVYCGGDPGLSNLGHGRGASGPRPIQRARDSTSSGAGAISASGSASQGRARLSGGAMTVHRALATAEWRPYGGEGGVVA